MEILAVLLIAALVFGLCFLLDKGFTRLFRSQAQHRSGKAVRLSKRYAAFGLILGVFGVAALLASIPENPALIVGSGIVIALGIGLVVHYLSFGVFYDEESFIFMTLTKPNSVYAYRDICAQQLYNNQGHILIELQLKDGRVIHLQQNMEGVYGFMDHAFQAWLRQTGRRQEECPFYDPSKSCWFPPVE